MDYQRGNWISTEYGEVQVKWVVFDDFEISGKSGRSLWAKNIQPIPLTEEWLVKFGFEKDTETKSWSILTSLEKFDYLFEVSNQYQEYFQPDFLRIDIKYVHQLQDLYSILTSEELSLK